MIYKLVREAVESVPELEGKVRPVAEVVDDLEPPFCIFNQLGSTPTRTMSGEEVCRTDRMELGFEAASIDDARLMAETAELLLLELGATAELPPGGKILWVDVTQTEEDALDVATGLMRHPITVEVAWVRPQRAAEMETEEEAEPQTGAETAGTAETPGGTEGG